MRAIFNFPERHAFCIFLSTPLALLLTTLCRVTSKSLDHPASTAKMILHWLISYPGYLCSNSHLSGAYLIVFSEVFLSWLLTQGQLISKVITCFSLLLTILASTLFALSSTLFALSSWYSPLHHHHYHHHHHHHYYYIISIILLLFLLFLSGRVLGKRSYGIFRC